MNQTIVFTQPAPVLEKALLGWFQTHKAKPVIRNSTSANRTEMWVDAEDKVARELYNDLEAMSKHKPAGPHDGLTGFYWAVFPQGTLWGDVYEMEKRRKQGLRKLAARPGNILRRIKPRETSADK